MTYCEYHIGLSFKHLSFLHTNVIHWCANGATGAPVLNVHNTSDWGNVFGVVLILICSRQKAVINEDWWQATTCNHM